MKIPVQEGNGKRRQQRSVHSESSSDDDERADMWCSSLIPGPKRARTGSPEDFTTDDSGCDDSECELGLLGGSEQLDGLIGDILECDLI